MLPTDQDDAVHSRKRLREVRFTAFRESNVDLEAEFFCERCDRFKRASALAASVARCIVMVTDGRGCKDGRRPGECGLA